ncbi:glycosyltransferase family 2 protein [Neobacillus mesonae]|nr:glycosyltransferase family 2 protein [Neobacillus mesonae]
MVDLGIVMPVYIQKPEFLKAAVESVLNQSFGNFRMVIVIDGAPEMKPLVESYAGHDDRVEIISYVNNQGVAHALNTGFDVLFQDEKIKYLTWVSSDNIYYPSFLSTLRNMLLTGPDELGLVYSSFQSIDNNGISLNDEKNLAALRRYQSQSKYHLLESSIIGVSFMYKSKYAKLIEGYYLVPVEDFDYWLRLTEHCEIQYTPVELMEYRVNSTYSVSATLQSSEQHRIWRYAYHLARHMARSRRNLTPMVTVLYPLNDADESSLIRLEDLYEQNYSDYHCYVLDLSPDNRVQQLLSSIPHPSTAFKWYPMHSEQEALKKVVDTLQTPFTIILNNDCFGYVLDMDTFVIELTAADPHIISKFFPTERTYLRDRLTPNLPDKMDFYNEMFRTHLLKQVLK